MEIWDAYYEDETLAGVDLIRDEDIPKGLYHGVAEIFVIHEDGSVLLMQRDWNKKGYPGFWESGAGGSILKGESFLEGAKRELLEETGIRAEHLQHHYRTMNEETIYHGYICRTNVPKDSIVLQEGETIAYRWVDWEEFMRVFESEQFPDILRERMRPFVEGLKYPNPFILERADPYMTKGSDGYYYFTASYPMKSDQDPEGYDRVILRRGKTIRELSQAEEITIWEADESTASHRFIWAPELHEINETWYIFYAGSCSTENRWAFDCHVLQCEGDDPYTGKWVEKGKFGKLPEDTFSFTGFSLDMTYFEAAGRSYVIWAQHNKDKISTLYLGEVNPEEPWHLISLPMFLSKPEYDWEKVRYAVNEGPAVIKHEGKIFVCFSASGTGPEYCVGVLEASEDSDLLSVDSWEKCPKPILTSEDLKDEYGPGHNSFVKDENGEDWIVYHARSKECFEGKCGYAENDPLYDPCRHARIRRVRWDNGGLGIDCEYSSW